MQIHYWAITWDESNSFWVTILILAVAIPLCKREHKLSSQIFITNVSSATDLNHVWRIWLPLNQQQNIGTSETHQSPALKWLLFNPKTSLLKAKIFERDCLRDRLNLALIFLFVCLCYCCFFMLCINLESKLTKFEIILNVFTNVFNSWFL